MNCKHEHLKPKARWNPVVNYVERECVDCGEWFRERPTDEPVMTHTYRVKKYGRTELMNKPCRVIGRGENGTLLIQFLGGLRLSVSRFALRKINA